MYPFLIPDVFLHVAPERLLSSRETKRAVLWGCRPSSCLNLGTKCELRDSTMTCFRNGRPSPSCCEGRRPCGCRSGETALPKAVPPRRVAGIQWLIAWEKEGGAIPLQPGTDLKGHSSSRDSSCHRSYMAGQLLPPPSMPSSASLPSLPQV